MERQLPKIQDLYNEVEVKSKENDLNVLLNQPPAEVWLKDHPMVKGLKYIPIQRIEWLLTKVFIRWNVEIKNVQLIANSVVVAITLNYKDPLNNEWLKQDGVGAMPLQTDKGASANDWTKIKASAVQMGAPAAESYAIKDAAEKIGKIFGKDMNRADAVAYGNITNFEKPEETLTKAKELLIEGLDAYQGEDKTEIESICQAKIQSGEFDMIFANEIANRLNIKL